LASSQAQKLASKIGAADALEQLMKASRKGTDEFSDVNTDSEPFSVIPLSRRAVPSAPPLKGKVRLSETLTIFDAYCF